MQINKINNWADFNKLVDYFGRSHSKIDWLFRGQSNHEWTLKSSLLRILPNNITKKKAHGYENGTIRLFCSEYNLYKENEINIDGYDDIFKLMVMQHYNCSTRLLDWTESIFIALYFATENPIYDGAIFCIPSNILNTNVTQSVGNINYKDLTIFSKYEENDIIYPLVATSKTRRMAIQQGNITISNNILADQQDIIEKYIGNKDNFIKIIINKELKIEAFDRLDHMNISGKTLFPGLDGLGKWDREYIIKRSFYEKTE